MGRETDNVRADSKEGVEKKGQQIIALNYYKSPSANIVHRRAKGKITIKTPL